MMIDRIEKQIRYHRFKDYLVLRIVKRENQLYLLRHGAESAREVESEEFEITVFLDHSKKTEKLRSSYTFTFKVGESIDHQLDRAKISLGLVKNRHYSLVRPQDYPKVEVFDSSFSEPQRLMEEISDLIYVHAPARNVSLSSAEIFLSTADIELRSSTGISANARKSKMDLEYTLLSHLSGREEEFNVNFTRRNYDPCYIRSRITESHDSARDMLKTRVPKNGKGHVIFRGENIYELFSPIIFHSSARAKDFGVSRFEPGHSITDRPVIGNMVSITSTGILPYGLYSGPFDTEGIAGQECLIVDRNIFKRYWATKQYADYIKVAPTGSFKNMAVQTMNDKTGSLPGDAYEIVQFSALNPDAVTGDFVAEIRFGYHHHNGQKTPIKGGSVSGNLFKCMSEIYLSGKTVFEGNYIGPDKIALSNLTIAGD